MTNRKKVIEKLKSTLALDADSLETAPLFENLESRLMLSTTSVSVTTDTGVVSGTTFIDSDSDGVQDNDESGVEGLTTTLLDSDGNTIASTTTDSDGVFSFEDLDAGTYTLVQDLEDDYAQSIDDNEGPTLVDVEISNSDSTELISDTTPTFVLTFSEEVTGESTDIVLVNSDGEAIGADSIVWDGNTATVTFATALDDGDYTLEFYSQSITNSEGDTLVTTSDEILSLTLDSEAPTVTVYDQRTSSASPTLKGYVSDTSATVYVTINGKVYEADVSGYYWTLDLEDEGLELTSGRYDISVEAADEAGNVGSDDTTGELSIYLLSGTFEDYGLDDYWTVVDQSGTSSWGVDSYEQLLQTSESESMLIYSNGDDYSDYSLFISLASADTDGSIGLVFRYVDENNYYRFSIDSDGTILLEKCEDGEFTTLASGTMDFELEETYDIEVRVIGSYLQINLIDDSTSSASSEDSIDRETLLSVYDDTFTSGSFGFYSSNNSGTYFGDIILESQEGVNLTPVIEEVTASYTTTSDLQSVNLSVSASDANTYDDLTYTWTIVSGSGTLENSDTSTTTYVPDDITEDETVTIQIMVSDGTVEVTETITFTIVDGDVVELLAEDFSEDLGQWVTVDQSNAGGTATWTIQNNALVQTSNAYDKSSIYTADKLGTYSYYSEGFWWDNYSVSVNVTTTDNDIYGVMVRYIDENNYYRFSWSNEEGCAQLIKCVNGEITVLEQTTLSYEVGETYNLTVSVDAENKIIVTIDGEEIFSVTDDDVDALSYGTIAMYTYGCADTSFSDVTVTNLNDVNPAPVIESVDADSDRISDAETATVTVTASDENDSDLTYTWSVDQEGGTLTVSEDGTTATYTPATVSEATTVTFTVTVSDGEKSDTQTLEITVVSADDVLIQDDFSDEDLDDAWTEGGESGDWSIQDGQLVQSSNTGTISNSSDANAGTYLIYDNGDEVWDDYTLYLTVMSADNDYIGVMFRYIDEDNYYLLSWSGTDGLTLSKCVDGEITVLYTDEDTSYESDEEYALTVSVEDQYIVVSIDGEEVISISDLIDGLSYGTIGLYNNINAGSYYDDVVVIAQ